jgi:hypothetical protein
LPNQGSQRRTSNRRNKRIAFEDFSEEKAVESCRFIFSNETGTLKQVLAREL